MNYSAYISSQAWQVKREQRIAFDGGRCAICHSTESLSVHHLHYESLGNEDVQHDLITACSHCHRWLDDIERYHRYQRRQRTPDAIDTTIPERTDVYGMAKSTVPIDLSMSDDYAQRSDRRPLEQVRQTIETSIIEAHENRFGL